MEMIVNYVPNVEPTNAAYTSMAKTTNNLKFMIHSLISMIKMKN